MNTEVSITDRQLATLAEASAAAAARSERRQAVGVVKTLSLGGILRSEWIKLSSLRSVRVTILVTLLAGIGLSVLLAAGWNSMLGDQTIEGDAAPSYLLMVATFAAPFLALIVGVLGVFAISSEYSSGMILSTLAAAPRRASVLFAKGLVLAIVTAVTALVLVLVGIAIAVGFQPTAATAIVSGTVVSGALGTVAYLVLIALFAFGIAAALRSTAGGIAILAGVTFVLPIAVSMLGMTGWDWVSTVNDLLPTTQANALSVGLQTAAEASADPMGMGESAGFGYWGALAVMAGWAAVALIPAAVLFQRRDAK